MKRQNAKIVTSIFLVIMLLSISIMPSFATTNLDDAINEEIVKVDKEEKILCDATLDDDFADD